MQGNIAAPDTPPTTSPDTPPTTAPDTPPTTTSSDPPPVDRLRSELSADLYALASHVMRNAHRGAFERIAELDLSFSQIKTLYTIFSSEQELSLKALAESLGMTFATMSRTVDSLVDRGFIDRTEDPEDRRMKRVTLTDAGAQVPAELNRSRLLGIQDLVESITDEEAQSLGGALRSLVAAHPEIAAHRPASSQTPTTANTPIATRDTPIATRNTPIATRDTLTPTITKEPQ